MSGEMIERVAIQATVAVDIERVKAGLWYASSPMIKGLLVAEHSREELLAKLPSAIGDLAAANMDPGTAALQRAMGTIRFRKRRIAQFTETATLHRLEGREDLAIKAEATIEEDRRIIERLRTHAAP